MQPNVPQYTTLATIGKCADGFQVQNLLLTTEDAMILQDYKSHTLQELLSSVIKPVVTMTDV
jgi:hypothetical protein